MITAQEARQKIEQLETERGKKEKNIAEEKITSAVEQGLQGCDLGIYVSDATEKWLISLGYKVERYSNQRDGSGTYVSW